MIGAVRIAHWLGGAEVAGRSDLRHDLGGMNGWRMNGGEVVRRDPSDADRIRKSACRKAAMRLARSPADVAFTTVIGAPSPEQWASWTKKSTSA